MRSTITLPERSAGSSRPSSVTSGRSAFGSACAQSARRRDAPRARAASTYVPALASTMPDRTSRRHERERAVRRGTSPAAPGARAGRSRGPRRRRVGGDAEERQPAQLDGEERLEQSATQKLGMQ
jgi:hypothetical protein